MPAKLFGTQAAFEAASDAIQLHGGMGLSKGVLVEQLLGDARAALIEDGTSDALALAARAAGQSGSCSVPILGQGPLGNLGQINPVAAANGRKARHKGGHED
jgi:hypothetical protein